MKNSPQIISFVSIKSNMGKTTLIENIIKKLKSKNIKVGILKHDTHKIDMDKKGKDTYRFSEAGANQVGIISKNKTAIIKNTEEEESLEEVIKLFSDVDLLILEGFKQSKFKKIEVHRKEVDKNLAFKSDEFSRESFVAIATDEYIEGIMNLDINNTDEIVKFIEDEILFIDKKGN